jgi:tetratricopeptide (TPR) repeat protein
MAKGRFRNIFGAKQLPLGDSNTKKAAKPSRNVRRPAAAGAETAPVEEYGVADYLGSARALREAGRLDDAEAWLTEAVERFPKDFDIAHEGAWLATEQQNWAEALKRWQRVRKLFPDNLQGYTGVATIQRQLGWLDEAEATLEQAIERFAPSPGPLVDYAGIAEARHDWAEAARRWEVVRQHFPDQQAGYEAGAIALCELDRHDEAQALLAEAAERFSADAASSSEAAGAEPAPHEPVASDAATELAHAAAEPPYLVAEPILPVETPQQALEALQKRSRAETPQKTKNTWISSYLTNLAMQFESLGGTGDGCEFGIFQRDLGAEPLGLLRWADLEPDQLYKALESEFEGVGSPENAIVFVREDRGQPEYWVRDRRHHIVMRCFVSPQDVPHDEMLRLVERQHKFLKDKLIDYLRSGSKIFVYKNLKRNLTDEELTRLHAALRRYGDNTLFYIRYSDSQHIAGTVEASEAPGLIIGYTDRFTHTPDTDERLGPTTDILRDLCASALTIWLSGVTQSQLPWRVQRHVFVLRQADRIEVIYRTGFTLSELVGADPDLEQCLLLEVYPEQQGAKALWDWQNSNSWLDPGMTAIPTGEDHQEPAGEDHKEKKMEARDESWFYNSGPPQRYTHNYQRYLSGGGLVRPIEDMARFSPGGKGTGDSARFWFFCLMLDQLQKEALLGDIAEVGVYKGYTAALLGTIARRLGKTAFLFDTFEGFNEKDLVGIDAGKRANQFSDTSLEAVRQLVGEENTRFIKGYFPNSAKHIPTESSFCLVHIDCDLYAPIVSSLEYFYPRMVPGGFIIIHDYSSFGWNGAEKAVDDFFADKPESVIPLFDSAGSAVIRRTRSASSDNWQLLQTQRLLGRGWVSAGKDALAFMLGGGWSGPEEWGVWGVGMTHEMRIPVSSSTCGDLNLELEVHAYLDDPQVSQEVRVLLDGETLAEWTFTFNDNYGSRSVLLRASDILAARPDERTVSVCLTFELRRLIPNPDGRPLGMALHRLKIEERPRSG